MILKLFLFLLPLALVAGEVVWSSDTKSGLSKEEHDKAIKEYVDENYPNEVKAWNKLNTVSLNGLMWQDNEDAKRVLRDWEGAKRYCEDLELVGYSDWRLPYIKELLSIVDKTRNPAIKKEFRNTISSYYWSSTTLASNTSLAWIVLFLDGFQSYGNRTFSTYVRCVRAGQ